MILNPSITLFLNPHNRHPYLLHTHRLTNQTTRRLELTTVLPSKASVPGGPHRRPMIRIESHTPDCITTLTFPTTSTQHQLSIMTLVTHILLSVPIITVIQSWNIETQQHTLQLILATITLRSYHKVWSSVYNAPVFQSSTQTLDNTTTNRTTPALPPRHRLSKRQRHT